MCSSFRESIFQNLSTDNVPCDILNIESEKTLKPNLKSAMSFQTPFSCEWKHCKHVFFRGRTLFIFHKAKSVRMNNLAIEQKLT